LGSPFEIYIFPLAPARIPPIAGLSRLNTCVPTSVNGALRGELFCVYRPVAEHQSAADAPQQYAPSDAALIAELSARAVLAEQRLGDIRELLTQARQDIERWRDGTSERSAVVVETRFAV
jgi:hypothetical protein